MEITKESLVIESMPFSQGYFSKVYKSMFNGKEYCYKEFYAKYPSDILSNIISLTEEKMSSEFLIPLYMVTDGVGNEFLGYLTDYNKELIPMDRNNRLIQLKNARDTVRKMHVNYGIIHGDLTLNNMLFDNDNQAYLLDFDSSLRIGQRLGNNNSFLAPVKTYLRFYPLDFSVDAYVFNLNTVAVLNGISIEYLFRLMRQGDVEINIPNSSVRVRTLCKELLLNDTRKPYSGEYIVDYL